MILLKHEENGSIECLYESSNILGSKYITNEKKLAIIFKSGRQYVYNDVTYEEYRKFELAESQGKILNSIIKGHEFEKSPNIVDVIPMVEQIDSIKDTL
jgi:predicted house-cleaning noncanonical NTP pyrophosphatase (MazG superfamily)